MCGLGRMPGIPFAPQKNCATAKSLGHPPACAKVPGGRAPAFAETVLTARRPRLPVSAWWATYSLFWDEFYERENAPSIRGNQDFRATPGAVRYCCLGLLGLSGIVANKRP